MQIKGRQNRNQPESLWRSENSTDSRFQSPLLNVLGGTWLRRRLQVLHESKGGEHEGNFRGEKNLGEIVGPVKTQRILGIHSFGWGVSPDSDAK